MRFECCKSVAGLSTEKPVAVPTIVFPVARMKLNLFFTDTRNNMKLFALLLTQMH